MKNKSKYRSNKNNKRLKIRQCSTYEPDFKKAVVLYAEQKSTSEAKRRYGISESNIRRWRRLRNDIMEKASQVKITRKSKRTNNTFESSINDFEAFDLSSSLDSMPLEQRLKTPTEQEPVLQSQPLSPTKLKVTRQAAKPPQPSPKPPTPEPPNEEVCLRWNSHHSNMQSTFPNLLLREQYVDATLVSEGQTLKCHRLILSSCSPYFEEVLSGISPFQHPVLFMKDIPFWILKSLCDFMYAGEVHIYQNKLEELLTVAETLKIKGLAGKLESSNEEAKAADPKTNKEEKEKKDERELRDRRKQPQQVVPAEAPTKTNSKSFRTGHASKKSERTHKEMKNDDILDPLDLLEPVYEELTKESKPPSVPAKFKENKNIPMRRSLPKKIKKRKLSEEREESPPPLFLSRKGTRSRPNVKIPKYYHTHYERVLKSEELLESTIVREPHTDQADPLMQLEEIKSEPLDVVDDVIEIEDNVVSFSDQEMPLQDEEILGNYDSPIFNLKEKEGNNAQTFKKISLLPQPIIMSVHSVAEKASTVKIIDVAQIKSPTDAKSDPLAAEITVLPLEAGKTADDPLNISAAALENSAEGITITNVESVAETDGKVRAEADVPLILLPQVAADSGIDITIANEAGSKPDLPLLLITQPEKRPADITIANVESVAEDVDTSEKNAHQITITNVQSMLENDCGSKNIAAESTTQEGWSNGAESVNKSVVTEEASEGNVDSDKVASDQCSDNEENANELGFHIAKVAREQFSMKSNMISVEGSELEGSELNASEQAEGVPKDVEGVLEDSGSAPNDLPESHVDAEPGLNNVSNEESGTAL